MFVDYHLLFCKVTQRRLLTFGKPELKCTGKFKIHCRSLAVGLRQATQFLIPLFLELENELTYLAIPRNATVPKKYHRFMSSLMARSLP